MLYITTTIKNKYSMTDGHTKHSAPLSKMQDHREYVFNLFGDFISLIPLIYSYTDIFPVFPSGKAQSGVLTFHPHFFDIKSITLSPSQIILLCQYMFYEAMHIDIPRRQEFSYDLIFSYTLSISRSFQVNVIYIILEMPDYHDNILYSSIYFPYIPVL